MTWLLSALLFVTDFIDPVSCTVQGYVYRMHELDRAEFTFRQENQCTGVRVVSKGSTIVLESPSHWVAIIIPPDYGNRVFWYRWGSRTAHVGVDEIPIHRRPS